jgi:hypothetical protein
MNRIQHPLADAHPNWRKTPNREWFIQKYIHEKKSGIQIAKELGTSIHVAYDRLRRFKIGVFNHQKSVTGERHPNWHGGRRKHFGYIRIYSPNHPQKDTHSTVYEHRLVAEKKIGRLLEKTEIVHHLNGVKDDNRPENLAVIENNSKHVSMGISYKSILQNRIKELEKIIWDIQKKKGNK